MGGFNTIPEQPTRSRRKWYETLLPWPFSSSSSKVKAVEEPQQQRLIMLMSGGLDSFLSAALLSREYEVIPLFVNYEQRAVLMEQMAVQRQIEYLSLQPADTITIRGISGGMANNLVYPRPSISDFYPGRNLQLLLTAAQRAISAESHHIAIGINRGFRSFPDTSQDFIQECCSFLSRYMAHEISILTPVSSLSKREEAELMRRMDLPFELVYSCQRGGSHHCGSCPSCLELFDALGDEVSRIP